MKRFVLALLLFLGMAVGADAQMMRFRATDLYTRTYEDGAWGDYGHKGELEARVVMDLEDDGDDGILRLIARAGERTN